MARERKQERREKSMAPLNSRLSQRAKRETYAARRRAFRVGLILLVLTIPSGFVMVQNMTSPNFRLQSGTFSGGGAVNLRSTVPGSSLGSVGTTIGQSSPIGVSQGPTSGITLEGGFWPVVATPVPEPSAALFLLSACAALALLARRRIRE
jgi:hypothetical protein